MFAFCNLCNGKIIKVFSYANLFLEAKQRVLRPHAVRVSETCFVPRSVSSAFKQINFSDALALG